MDNRTLASRDCMFYYIWNMSFSKQVVFRGLGSTSVLSASFIVHKNVYKCQISFYIRIVGDDSVSVWCYSFNVLSISMYTYSNISYLLSYILYLISYILYLVSYILYLISSILYLVSYIVYLISHISYLISHISYLISHISYLISHIVYRISRISYLISRISSHVSRVSYPISHISNLITDILNFIFHILHRFSWMFLISTIIKQYKRIWYANGSRWQHYHNRSIRQFRVQQQ